MYFCGMKDIFYELRSRRNAAILDEEDSLSVVYQGMKFVLEDDEVFILSTETDIYQEVGKDVYEAIYEHGLDHGIDVFKAGRYGRAIKRLNPNTQSYKELKQKIDETKDRIQRRVPQQ